MPAPQDIAVALQRPNTWQTIRDALASVAAPIGVGASALAPAVGQFAAPALGGLGTAVLAAPFAYTMSDQARRAEFGQALQGAWATAQEAARRFTPWGRTVFPEASVAVPTQQTWAQSLQPMLSQGNDFTLVPPPSTYRVATSPFTYPGEMEASIPWPTTATRTAPLDVPLPERAAPARSAAPFQMQTWQEPQAASAATAMPTYYGNDAFPTLQAPPLSVPADVPTRRQAAGTATRSATAQQAAPRYQDVELGGRYVAPMQTYQERPAAIGTASAIEVPAYIGNDAYPMVAAPAGAPPVEMKTWQERPEAVTAPATMPTYYGQDAVAMPRRAPYAPVAEIPAEPVSRPMAGVSSLPTTMPGEFEPTATVPRRATYPYSPVAEIPAEPIARQGAGVVSLPTTMPGEMEPAVTMPLRRAYPYSPVADVPMEPMARPMAGVSSLPTTMPGEFEPTATVPRTVSYPRAPVAEIPAEPIARPLAGVSGLPTTMPGEMEPAVTMPHTRAGEVATTVPLDVPVPERIPRTRTETGTATLPLDVPVPERLPRERVAEGEAAVAPLDVPIPERIPRTVAPGAEATTVPPGPLPPDEPLAVPLPETPERERPAFAGAGGASAQPVVEPATEAPPENVYTDDDWTQITEQVLGESIPGTEMNEWLRNFSAEHNGQMPWEVGPGDAAGNFIDHLLALGESRAAANQGQDVNQTWWERAYADRYPGEFQPYQAATGLAGAPDAQSLLNTIQGLITNLGVGQSAYNQYVGR